VVEWWPAAAAAAAVVVVAVVWSRCGGVVPGATPLVGRGVAGWWPTTAPEVWARRRAELPYCPKAITWWMPVGLLVYCIFTSSGSGENVM
jgi:hypothetical protein